MGVMADLVAHCFPPATISDEGGATLVWTYTFLETLVLSSCFEVEVEVLYMR